MPFLDDAARAALKDAEPGLELIQYWKKAAADSSEHARALLSYIVGSLLNRGWVHPFDKTVETAADQIGEPQEKIRTVLDELIRLDLISVEGNRIATLAGLIATKPTGHIFYLDHEHQLHLTGPLAGLAVAKALRRKGEVRSLDGVDAARRLVLGCDESGIATRAPESIAMFLPSWDGDAAPSVAMTGGAYFADDDALGAWQTERNDPAGMPVASFLFPMAAVDLGADYGAALDPVLNHRPDFD
ncbi:MAG: hypothetical protein EXR79_01480 [Myxococcales bacterium]|nr:hypothetical protein [Myxococcales bacterium]